jgi:hypothetical protein
MALANFLAGCSCAGSAFSGGCGEPQAVIAKASGGKTFMMNQPLPRSTLGIASFVIAIGTFVLAALLVGLAIAVIDKSSRGIRSDIDNLLYFGFFIGAPAAHFVGLVLGIIALFQKRRGKTFAVFGIILNILFPAGAVLIIVGLLSMMPGVR